MDREAKLREGLWLARPIFARHTEPGVPLTPQILLKPSIPSVRRRQRPEEKKRGRRHGCGPARRPDPGPGGPRPRKLPSAGTNRGSAGRCRSSLQIHERHGAGRNEPEPNDQPPRAERAIVGPEAPDGGISDRIPHPWPVNAPDTRLLNFAPWKGHSMCLTPAVKNEQGLVCLRLLRSGCGRRRAAPVPAAMPQCGCARAGATLFRQLPADGHPVVPSPGRGPREESAGAGSLDPQDAGQPERAQTGPAILGGISGRDGEGFGPGPEFLTRRGMFSRAQCRMDVIGLWLAGPEPGNVSLWRIAEERGLSDTFHPRDIELSEWTDSGPERRRLGNLPGSELTSFYRRSRCGTRPASRWIPGS